MAKKLTLDYSASDMSVLKRVSHRDKRKLLIVILVAAGIVLSSIWLLHMSVIATHPTTAR